MAASKSAQNPHKWADGTWHSISQARSTQNRAANNPNSANLGQIAAGAAVGSVPGAAAPAAPGTPAPVAPAAVDPFFTADDLDAIGAFDTDLKTKLQAYDTNLQNLETDTTYQKTQGDNAAKQNTGAATDDAAARGIFQSSIKDATLYDIEAQRSLSAKFLDDKLTTARLDAGSNKKILGDAKVAFDANMAKRKVANAQGVNDANSSAWATAQAAWAAAQPVSTPVGAAPPAPTVKPPTKGVTQPPTPAAASAASNFAASQAQGTAAQNAAVKAAKKPAKPKQVYGG